MNNKYPTFYQAIMLNLKANPDSSRKTIQELYIGQYGNIQGGVEISYSFQKGNESMGIRFIGSTQLGCLNTSMEQESVCFWKIKLTQR